MFRCENCDATFEEPKIIRAATIPKSGIDPTTSTWITVRYATAPTSKNTRRKKFESN